MLRYGDGTPFPLTENVLPVIADTVTVCTAMFEAAAELDRMREDAQAARTEIEGEQRRLMTLEQSLIEATTVPGGEEKVTASRRAAQKALAAGRRAVRESRMQLERYASSRATEPRWELIADRVHAAAAAFFAQRTLPHTKWTWFWDASGSKPTAGAESHAAQFTARFDLPLDPIWRAPVRVGILAQSIVLPLHRSRMLRRPQLANVPLDTCLLVYAARDVETRVLLLREHATASTSWRITIPDHGPALATTVDRRGRAVSPDVELTGGGVQRLWAALEADVLAMVHKRVVREVTFDGRAINEIRDVTATPRALLDYLGPLISEIRQRSRVPGELSLKRDVGEGVREELFIPRTDITARYSRLPAAYRQLLDAAGLGRGVTSVIEEPMSTVRALPRAPRATPPPPPLTPAPVPVKAAPLPGVAPAMFAAGSELHRPDVVERVVMPKRAPRVAVPVAAPQAPTLAVASTPDLDVALRRQSAISGLITPAPVPLARLPKLPKMPIPHVPKLAPAPPPPVDAEAPTIPSRPSQVALFDHGNVDFRKLRM